MLSWFIHAPALIPVFPSLTSSQRTDPPAFYAMASCPVVPPSRARPSQILESGPAEETEREAKYIFDPFSLSFHHHLGY